MNLPFVEIQTYAHADLVTMAREWLRPKCSVVVSEICVTGAEQPDALGWKGAATTLIECKASRSDFLADKNKIFRYYLEEGIGDYRYYLAPVGVIKDVSELPNNFGWLEIQPNGRIKTRHKAEYQPEKQTALETKILVSLLRRIGQQPPNGCTINCYTYETKQVVLEVESI
jgi:hypothetical protein